MEGLYRSISTLLCVICVWITYSSAQNQSPKGPCGESVPCEPGTKLADPMSCGWFYECSADGSSFIIQGCPTAKSFDTKRKACRKSSKAVCLKTCGPPLRRRKLESSDLLEGIEAGSLASDNTATVENEKDKDAKNTVGNEIVEEKDGSESQTIQNAPGTTDEEAAGGNDDKIVTTEENTELITDGSGVGVLNNDTLDNSLNEEWINITAVVPTEKDNLQPTSAEDKDDQGTITTTATSTTLKPSTKLPTTTSSSTTTQVPTEPVVTTTTTVVMKSTSIPKIVIPEESLKPPYDVVTEEPPKSGNGTASDQIAQAGMSTTMIAIIAGATAGAVLVIALVILTVCLVRRRKFSKHHNIKMFENPEYSRPDRSGPREYRFSRDPTLYVGPTVNFTALNNNQSASSVESLSSTIERKKRPAPPIPSSATSSASKSKRHAPPPPNPFTGKLEGIGTPERDLYEKDSPPGSTDNIPLSTFANPRAKLDFGTKPAHPEHDISERTPAKEDKKAEELSESLHSDSGSKTNSKDSLQITRPNTNSIAKQDATPTKDKLGNGHVAKATDANEDNLQGDGNPFGDDMDEDEGAKEALLEKYKEDGVSVDSYDLEKNPFFADD